jgi:hypothetical protein
MTAPRALRSVTIVLCLAGLLPARRSAAAAPAAGPSSDEAAQQAFREGVDAARQAHWPEARVLFERAYVLSPRPVVLINLAGAQARTGHLIEAAANYHRIVDDSTSADTASFRKAAAEVLPELEQRIPTVRVHPTGSSGDDTFQIDGETATIERLAEGIPLDPGQHTLVVERGGVERARVLFSLAEREAREIPLALPATVFAARPPVAGGGGQPTINLTPVAPPEEEKHAPQRSWWASPWTWTGVGVVLVAASAVLFVSFERREQPFSGNITPGQISLR